MASIYEKLALIQQEMKAPKNLKNTFGNYNYRNCESILEALKPYESKYKVCLTLHDDIYMIAERFYVKATATLYDLDTSESISVSAFARESATKKGMDDSQVTGACSSYARKYALNGLFLLDDTKDADTDEFAKQEKAMTEKKVGAEKKAEASRMKKVNEVIEALAENDIDEQTAITLYKVNSLKELDIKKCENILKHIEDIKKKQEEQK